jgi:hypothetical protein
MDDQTVELKMLLFRAMHALESCGGYTSGLDLERKLTLALIENRLRPATPLTLEDAVLRHVGKQTQREISVAPLWEPDAAVIRANGPLIETAKATYIIGQRGNCFRVSWIHKHEALPQAMFARQPEEARQ